MGNGPYGITMPHRHVSYKIANEGVPRNAPFRPDKSPINYGALVRTRSSRTVLASRTALPLAYHGIDKTDAYLNTEMPSKGIDREYACQNVCSVEHRQFY